MSPGKHAETGGPPISGQTVCLAGPVRIEARGGPTAQRQATVSDDGLVGR